MRHVFRILQGAMYHNGTYLRKAFLLLATATAGGCSETLDAEATNAIRIEASIDRSAPGPTQTIPSSRTSTTGNISTFVSGDNIGVYETLTGRSNVPYVYNGSSWSTASLMYWQNRTSTHTFYAYYPYKATASGTTVSIPVLSTQTMSTTPNTAIDLLVAGPLAQSRATSPAVGLTFKHAYALIQLNVKMGILGLVNPYTLNRITIRGGNPSGNTNPYGIANVTGTPPQVGYNLSTGAITAATNDAQSYAQTFYSDITGVNLFTTAVSLYAFVLPGTYSTPKPAVSFRVTLLLVTSNSSYANFPNTTFQPGMKYVYDVSIGLNTRSSGTMNTMLELQEVVPLSDAFPDMNQ